ncbi:jg13881 [Pararge aegeria aegeria]|uniref:Jg13881 protein n=1 Tax=Pararge aegeria aegeria TaxID=348720 RepID=A0A8S4S4P2_9NEOP|nr:jg13881 [Pararge aegeria aegeria]
MTGLSPRVIRVWFQNKRCKDKKKTIQLKMQMQQEKEGRRLGYMSMGVPLVAGSPVRHEAGGSLALEVTAYQPPWKALSDFALHADLDRAPHHSAAFQQLVNQCGGARTRCSQQNRQGLHKSKEFARQVSGRGSSGGKHKYTSALPGRDVTAA